jgi:membrane protein YdbS with pleckstrin-like domain
MRLRPLYHPPMTAEPVTLRRAEPGYRQILRIHSLLFWLPVAVGAIVVDQLLLAPTPVHNVLSILVPLLALLGVIFIPHRRWGRLGYALHPKMLQVVRGWLFHTDTIVPLVRVQHIDVTRGPLDKIFGTATLVVHTAGTHNSIVTLPGLSPDNASAIRDEIRQHIRSDFE